MWNRKAIKQAAKKRMSANYWKMVLIGMILAVLTGGANVNFTFNQDKFSKNFPFYLFFFRPYRSFFLDIVYRRENNRLFP